MTTAVPPAPARLRPADLARVASVGPRTRRLRAALSVLGSAIGGADLGRRPVVLRRRHPQAAVLAPQIDTSVLVGFPAAQKHLNFDGHPSTIYVRARQDQVSAVYSILAATADPENPGYVDVSRPSDALVARADA